MPVSANVVFAVMGTHFVSRNESRSSDMALKVVRSATAGRLILVFPLYFVYQQVYEIKKDWTS
jgi:predicted small secreted protein